MPVEAAAPRPAAPADAAPFPALTRHVRAGDAEARRLRLALDEAAARDGSARKQLDELRTVSRKPRENVRRFRTSEASISVEFQSIRLLLGPLIISARVLEI